MKNYFLQNIEDQIKKIDQKLIYKTTRLLQNLKNNNKVILAGNGASASISSHVSVDLTKAAGFRTS